jgi:hypothetical protein
MRTLHQTLSCPLCGLPYEHIETSRVEIAQDLPGLPQESIDAIVWPASGRIEFLACQHGAATSGPAVGLVPPRPAGVQA